MIKWKNFQFLPNRGYAVHNAGGSNISDQQIKSAVDYTLARLGNNINDVITIADRDYLQNNYFSILPDGSMRVTINDQDIIAGSLFKQSVKEK